MQGSDDEVIEASVMDRRWQLVLDCLDTQEAPFSKGTLIAFRQRLIEANMDRRLIERTIEIASQSQAFGSRALRAALDSSPLWGAGRVEDTYNLVGHALFQVGHARGGRPAGAGAGRGSTRGWSRPHVWHKPESGARSRLGSTRAARRGVGLGLEGLANGGKLGADFATGSRRNWLQPFLEIALQVEEQDVQVDKKGKASLIKGVDKSRRSASKMGRCATDVKVAVCASIYTNAMCFHDLDTGLIRAVGVTPANVPEASVTAAISADLA